MQPMDFVRLLDAAFEIVMPSASRSVREITIAQAAFESAWAWPKYSSPPWPDERPTAATAYNFWNMTRTPSDNRPFILGWDKHADGSKYLNKFRAYSSVEDGLQDYFVFLSQGRYARSFKMLMDGDFGFFVQLGKDGWYESTSTSYDKGCRALLVKVIECYRIMDVEKGNAHPLDLMSTEPTEPRNEEVSQEAGPFSPLPTCDPSKAGSE